MSTLFNPGCELRFSFGILGMIVKTRLPPISTLLLKSENRVGLDGGKRALFEYMFHEKRV